MKKRKEVVMKKYLLLLFVTLILVSLNAQNLWETPLILNNTEHSEILDLLKFNNQNYVVLTQQDDYCQNFIFVNKLDDNGVALWGAPIEISDLNLYTNQAQIVKSSDNNLIVVWNQYNTNGTVSLFAQKIDASGQTLWTDKKEVTNSFYESQNINIIPSDNGGVIVAWLDNQTQNFNIQLLNGIGNLLYSQNGLSMPQSQGFQYRNMLQSGDMLNLVLYNATDFATTLYKVNTANNTGSIQSNVIQESYFTSNVCLKVIPDNKILISLTSDNDDCSHLKMLENNGSVIFDKFYDHELIRAIELIDDSQFVVLFDLYNDYIVRKMNFSGTLVDSILYNDEHFATRSRLADIVKFDTKIMFTLEVNFLIDDSQSNAYIYIEKLIYNPITNNLLVSNHQNVYPYSIDGFFNSRNIFISSSDNVSTSFIGRKTSPTLSYYFNSVMNNNFSYAMSSNLLIMNDVASTIYSFKSASLNDKVYYLTTKSSVTLSSLSSSQISETIRNFSNSGYSTSFINKINDNTLFIALNSFGHFVFEHYPYDRYLYWIQLFLYKPNSGFVASFNDNRETDYYIAPKTVFGEDNQSCWLANNPWGLYRTSNDSLLWGYTSPYYFHNEIPLSINSGNLLALYNGNLILKKFNPQGHLYDQWPQSGVILSDIDSDYYEQTLADSYLTQNGLLLLWGKCINANKDYQIYAHLLNSVNGNSIWTSDSLLVTGQIYKSMFINNKLYVSYFDALNNSLKMNCYSLSNTCLNLLWSRTISNSVVKEYDLKVINNRFVFAFSALNNDYKKIYIRVLDINGNLDQNTNDFLVCDKNMQAVNPVINDLGQNNAMLLYLGYQNPNYKNMFASLLDLNSFIITQDTVVDFIPPFFVYPNYPNPFNPSTNISFDLEKRNTVNISIYNIKGQKVRALCNQMFEMGNHTVVWNGKDDKNQTLSSGIYFAKVKNGNREKTIKMIMVK